MYDGAAAVYDGAAVAYVMEKMKIRLISAQLI